MVLVIVQPVDHRGTLRHRHEEVLVFTKTHLTERLDHVFDLIVVIDFGDAGREKLMVEKAEFLLERGFCIDHSPDPRGVTQPAHRSRFPPQWVVTQELVDIHGILSPGVQKLVDGSFIAEFDPALKLFS